MELSPRLNLLLSPRLHSPAISRTRALLIAGRVRAIARLFALLTVAWIPVDIALLPAEAWAQLAIARVATATAFVVLGRLSPDVCVSLPLAYQRIFALFAVPVAFLFFAMGIISDNMVHDSIVLSTTYFFAPFVVVAGISFFPMTLMEGLLLFVAPLSIIMAFYIHMFGGAFGPSEYEVLWVLVLVMATAAMGGASQIGFLLQLFEDTALDSLTGLYVRKVGEAIVSQQFAAAVRNALPFSVLFLDIDHFKKINDLFGHEDGDEVISEVAQKIRHIMRHQDIAIRWGGEEFLVVLPNTTPKQAEAFLRRLGKDGLTKTSDGKPVTASVGVAEWKTEEVSDWQTLIHRADQRLYTAKRAGRNCYVLQDEAQLWLG